MATKDCNHKNPLNRTGTSQAGRNLAALSPDFVQIDGRTTENLMDYAYRFAEHIKYFGGTDFSTNDGNWQPFFEVFKEKSLAEIEATASNEPHIALFLCFLKILQNAQNQLNEIPKRHLDFYYKQVLQLKKKPAKSDTVHLIFELAKNATEQFIAKGTAFQAGKDATGKPRNFIATEDTVINNAKVEHLRSVLNKNGALHFASIANSADGMGEDLPKENPMWQPFGHEDLPRAATGFALASPALLLREGARKITLTLALKNFEPLQNESNNLKNNTEIYLSGEKDWLGPFSPTKINLSKIKGQHELAFTIELTNVDEAVLPFNPTILSGDFNTSSPVARISFKPDSKGYQRFQNATLVKVRIATEVTGIKEFKVENDFGPVENTKPFMPFGPIPKKGSNLFIGSDEIFQKDLTKLSLKMNWQSPPSNFYNHYQGYKNRPSNTSFTATASLLKDNIWDNKGNFSLFENDATEKHISNIIHQPEAVKTNRFFARANWIWRPAFLQKFAKKQFVPLFERGLFRQPKVRFAQAKKQLKDVKDKGGKAGDIGRQKNGFLKLTLTRDFGHQEFPTEYSLAMARKIADQQKAKPAGNIHIPNEPYTPILASLVLDYHSTTNWVSLEDENATEQNFDSREIQFFQIAPFGQTERHPYLNQQSNSTTKNQVSLLPSFPNEGEFYLGISGIEPLQTVKILFQMVEESANPDRQKPEIKWSVLSNNHWITLDDKSVLADFTNDFLTSGIIKFYLPEIATDNNSILEEGFYWIRASIPKHPDSVSQMVNVHAQSIRAVFNNNDNSLEHLETALAGGTISKLVTRLPKVKKVEQPYGSFGGQAIEKDGHFYKRVSERLRHKNRAVSIWDYEHLILEQFPSIYKIKCLNHTSPTAEIAPGNVTLITIPNLKNQTAVNRLRPKVSAQTLFEVKNYIQNLSTHFTTIHTQNPDYEEIKLEFKVAFRKNFEFGFYRNELEKALIQFMTPWAFDTETTVEFGGKINKSILINFIEKLEYVDFVQDFFMHHISKKGIQTANLNEIEASNSRAILVSALTHTIKKI